MKVRKPDYYDKFRCLAGDCEFTCCQEWKIAVDEETNAKWKKILPPPETKTRRKNLSLFTTFKDGSRVIALNSDHKCPFLNEEGLCRLVLTYGEESLSETCHIFPREKHDFGNLQELTLMPSCPYVVDLLNESAAFTLSTEEAAEPEAAEANTEEGLLALKDQLMQLFADNRQTPEEGLLAAYYILMSKKTSPVAEKDLQELLAAIEALETDEEETFIECGELFLDLAENYRKQNVYSSLLGEAAAFTEEILDAGEEHSYGPEFASEWKAYAPLLNKWLAQEIYADLLLPEGDGESMTIKLQWIAMEYALLRQLAWTCYRSTGALPYEAVKENIVLASRMMGYEEADITEYMENSFESILWEWGYFVLVTGKLK